MEDKSKKPSQTRRAILKGSLAAPVVLTVASPSAAASSFARCIRNAPNVVPNESELFVQSTARPTTGWWRVSVQVVRFQKPAPDSSITDWLYLDPVKGYVSVSNPITTPGIPQADIVTLGWQQYGSTECRWLVAWFDDTGTRYQLQVQKPASYKPSSVSCHASFAPGPDVGGCAQ